MSDASDPKAPQSTPQDSGDPQGGDQVPFTTIDLLKFRAGLATSAFTMAEKEKKYNEGIGQTLIRLGLIDAGTYNESLLSQGQTRHLEKLHIDPSLLRGITPQFLNENKVLPLYREGQKLHFVYAGNLLKPIEHMLQQVSGASMARGTQMSEDQFFRLLYHHFPQLSPDYLGRKPVKPGKPADLKAGKPAEEKAPAKPVAPAGRPLPGAMKPPGRGDTQTRPAPGHPAQDSAAPDAVELFGPAAEDDLIVRTVDRVIRDALQKGATDVHIEPSRDSLRVRYRVDGVLLDQGRFPDTFSRAVAARVKVLSSMKSHINFLPQSGRMSYIMDGMSFDLRVSVLPSIYGEAVVLRVLPQGGAETTLEDRGLTGETLDRFSTLISRSAGVVLVVGPTGSGKSSTLFSSLNTISTPEIKLVTLEDPAEYKLDTLVQCSIDAGRGYTFEEGLREILRHDPDVILVGEIRDRVTAEIAIQASLTGHLVFSTLHTIDASSSVMRLVDIGVPRYQIEAGLIGVLAQRLVRRLCRNCAEEREMTHEHFARYGLTVPEGEYKLLGPVGCDLCREGFKGRTGVFELLVVDDAVRAAIRNSTGVSEIRDAGRRNGMRTLLEDGQRLVMEKITSIEEVVANCI